MFDHKPGLKPGAYGEINFMRLWCPRKARPTLKAFLFCLIMIVPMVAPSRFIKADEPAPPPPLPQPAFRADDFVDFVGINGTPIKIAEGTTTHPNCSTIWAFAIIGRFCITP